MPHPFRCIVPLLAVALLASGAGATTESADSSDRSAAPDEPPILLRSTMLFTPAEAAGTGVAPEIEVEVTIDPRGVPRKVEVLSVTPSTEYDDVFRSAATEAIERWRYAPARTDGEPVETSLRWTIQFQERVESSFTRSLGFSTLTDTGAILARIRNLPEAELADRLRHRAAIAEEHLDTGERRRADTPRFVVISDTPHPETARTVAANLEAVFGLLDRTLGAELGVQRTDFKLVVYVFWRRSALTAVGQELGVWEWASGFYSWPGLFVFHLETETVHDLLGTLVHEAVHAYVDRHLLRPGFRLPPVVNEGLAEYFGNSEIDDDGRLNPGRIREGRFVLDRRLGGAYRRTTDAGWSLDEAQRAVRREETATAWELLAMERTTFYGPDRREHYALSWLLVHFLRHGEPGWSTEKLPKLLLYVAEGYPARAAVETVYGLSGEELDRAFRAYVKKL